MEFTCKPDLKTIQQFKELFAPMGLLTKKNNVQFTTIRVLYFPFFSSMDTYSELGRLQEIWQKLLFKVSIHDTLIQKTYRNLIGTDPYIGLLMEMYCEVKEKLLKEDTLTIFRVDYFLDQMRQFKLIQFNMQAVSMLKHTENIQKAKKIINPQLNFPFNQPAQLFINQLNFYFKENNLKGFLLFVINAVQTNIVQQKLIQIKLLQLNIRCKRVSLDDLNNTTIDKNNNLFYENELVSCVYFRTGYTLKHYEGNPHLYKQSRLRVAKSNVLSIPNVAMELVNQKRMQAQLTSPQLLSQFLPADEVKLIMDTLMETVALEKLSQKEIICKMQNCVNYIFKPNMEGGNNNLLGQQMFKVRKQDWSKYIMMRKIDAVIFDNEMLSESNTANIKCIYQISRFGVVRGKGKDIVRNNVQGYLIRGKPHDAKEGGIMSGVGAIGTWCIQ